MAGVTVKLTSGGTVKGMLFCIDPVTNAMVVKHEDNRFTLVNPLSISSVEGDTSTPMPNLVAMGVSISNMEKKEDLALAAAEKNLESINNDVSPLEQNLYDKLSSIFAKTRWEGNSIVILENIIIDPPYHQAVIQGGDNSQLSFVQKVLAGERKKLGMD